jgi:hypothetical protein
MRNLYDEEPNAYDRILGCLGRRGPLTAKQLRELTGLQGIYTRISEFNKVYSNIEIGKTNTKPVQYFIKFPEKINIDYSTVYPDSKFGIYKMNRIKAIRNGEIVND